jgi:hypothetical protein
MENILGSNDLVFSIKIFHNVYSSSVSSLKSSESSMYFFGNFSKVLRADSMKYVFLLSMGAA